MITQERLVASAKLPGRWWRRGRDDGLVERCQKHRQHRADDVGTSVEANDGRGAIGGASLSSMTSVGMRDSSSAISAGNVSASAGWQLCRSNLFISGVISACTAQRRDGIVLRINIWSTNRTLGSRLHAVGASHDHIVTNYVIAARKISSFGRFFGRARTGSSAGHCTIYDPRGRHRGSHPA